MIYKEATPERRMIMRNKMQMLLLVLIASLVFTGPILGSDVFIYPNKGQSQKQQDKDKYECYGWAKQQTGFDPMAQPTATAPPPLKKLRRAVWFEGLAAVRWSELQPAPSLVTRARGRLLVPLQEHCSAACDDGIR